jgi:hypothetical protein
MTYTFALASTLIPILWGILTGKKPRHCRQPPPLQLVSFGLSESVMGHTVLSAKSGSKSRNISEAAWGIGDSEDFIIFIIKKNFLHTLGLSQQLSKINLYKNKNSTSPWKGRSGWGKHEHDKFEIFIREVQGPFDFRWREGFVSWILLVKGVLKGSLYGLAMVTSLIVVYFNFYQLVSCCFRFKKLTHLGFSKVNA